jgi:hypothetical protein
VFSQARKHLEPVNPGHPDVRYDERYFFGERLPQPVVGVIGEEKIVPKGTKKALHREQVCLAVIYHDNRGRC